MPGPVLTATVDAPWGPIRLAATSRGLAAVDQLVSAEDFAARVERRFRCQPQPIDTLATGAAIEAARRQARAAVSALEEFLGGDLGALETLPLDLEDSNDWDRRVLGAVRGIRPGSTASYGEVARMIGKPGAARAVGGAVGRNPIGLAIPCHRVIAGDGTLGGYGGGWWGGAAAGRELKRQLLEREGVRLAERSRG